VVEFRTICGRGYSKIVFTLSVVTRCPHSLMMSIFVVAFIDAGLPQFVRSQLLGSALMCTFGPATTKLFGIASHATPSTSHTKCIAQISLNKQLISTAASSLGIYSPTM
jgi:hypothetical protein